MVGGDADAVARMAPIFDTLAPGVERRRAHARAARGDPDTAERGWLHCGPSGAGHFVKMVHNGIEYGLMAAYAEGLNVLAKAGVGSAAHAADAETAPLDHPEYYQYDIDLAAVTEVWRRGSVVASWLLDLTAEALHDDPELAQFGGHVSDSGEGRWTIHAAIDEGVPVPGAVGRAVRALQLAGTLRRRRQGAVGDAGRIRRPRRTQGVVAMSREPSVHR